jgi:hypothetical protein
MSCPINGLLLWALMLHNATKAALSMLSIITLQKKNGSGLFQGRFICRT